MTDLKGSTSRSGDFQAQYEEWDDISCPICMEHPHNAVLLICSSHEKGCRSYICDTSCRHSNCLDRFRKMQENITQPISSVYENVNRESSGLRNSNNSMHVPLVETHEDYALEENSDEIPAGLFEALEDNNHNNLSDSILGVGPEEERSGHERSPEEKSSELSCLKCPLCRGTVMGWMIVKEARRYWDLKPRSCSMESCSFSGNYRELRGHARGVHPKTRPADADPTRQRAWRHLERQQEHGDILSAIRSAMPGTIVMGDYVLDDIDGLTPGRESAVAGEGSRPLRTTFYLFHVFNPMGVLEELAGSPRPWRRRRRGNSLWGENLLGLQSDDNDDSDEENPDGDDLLMPRRRRRITRSRSGEDNS